MRMGQIYNLYTRLPTFPSAYKQINKQYNNHYNPLVWILKPLFFFLSTLKEKTSSMVLHRELIWTNFWVLCKPTI